MKNAHCCISVRRHPTWSRRKFALSRHSYYQRASFDSAKWMRYFGFLLNEIKFPVSTAFHWLRNGKSRTEMIFRVEQYYAQAMTSCHWLITCLGWEGSPADFVPHQKRFLVTEPAVKTRRSFTSLLVLSIVCSQSSITSCRDGILAF